MMKTVKTSEVTGDALDWAVAKCEGITPIAVKKRYSEGYILYSLPSSTLPLEYSNKWAQGGPIIERGGIGAYVVNPSGEEMWLGANYKGTFVEYGPTPLIAAMRCYVASKLGETIEVPEELL